MQDIFTKGKGLMAYRTSHPWFKKSMDDYGIPDEMEAAFWNYFAYGIEPGGLGMAILRNDFYSAVCKTHPSLQLENLQGMAKWIINSAPLESYGSIEAIVNWKKKSDEERRDIMIAYRLRPSVIDVLMGESA